MAAGALSLAVARGRFDPIAAARFGAEACIEPLIGPVNDRPAGMQERTIDAPIHLEQVGSLFSLEPGNVHLVALKPAVDGQGIIVRLQEIGGQATEFQLDIAPAKIASILACDLLENPVDDSAPKVEGHTVYGHIKPYRLQTFRLQFA